MLHVTKLLIFTGFNFYIVKCMFPTLSVHTLDKRLIERKRQDTFDMCRLFTSETQKLNAITENQSVRYNGRKRLKRETGTQKFDEVEMRNAERVESIVDKLYDDLEENGKKVTFRQGKIDSSTTTTVKVLDVQNTTMRRFNFAPAELLGPQKQDKYDQKSEEKTVPSYPVMDWPKRWKHGIVPYFIDSKTYDSQLADVIMKAFDYFEKVTCIRLQRLKDRPTDKDSLQNVEWLYVTNPSGLRQCVHSNEKKSNKGVQMVIFGYDCMSLGEILHEIMHILGFSHEHTRPDRDQYITVLWNNIKPGYKKYFEARSNDPLLESIEYDYTSVMHYPPRAFSKNGQATLLSQNGIKIGQRDGLSDSDKRKVDLVYGTECQNRNQQYLIETCPSVVKGNPSNNNEKKKVTQEEIQDYFKDRIWPYGIINYKLRDKMEFSAEERENIKAVIDHIHKETCIIFREVPDDEEVETETQPNGVEQPNDVEISNKQSANDSKIDEKFDSDSKKKITSTSSENDGHVSLQETNNGNVRLFKNKDKKTYIKNNNEGTSKLNETVSLEQSVDLGKLTEMDNVINSNEFNEVTDPIPETIERRKGVKPKTSETGKNIKNQTSQRRHAENILVLARSVEPGCTCPPPGRPSGYKVLYLNADCFNSVNDLLHLFVHLLGLDHQHNMYDRDSYLHIVWDNLTPAVRDEMQNKLPPAASLGFEYDYQSVMHYPWLQIKDGVTNIMYPIWNDGWAMGHWQGLSSTDVFKLELIYFEQCLERRKDVISVL